MHMFKQALIICILCLLVMGGVPWQARAQTPCEEEKEILGLSLTSSAGKGGNKLLGLFATKERGKSSGLRVSSVEPLSSAARLGLQAGDVIEQANSWLMHDCRSYRQAITDAKKGEKALLLLVAHAGKKRAVTFAPTVWEEPQKKAKETVASLKTLLEAPLPPPLKAKVEPVGEEMVLALRSLEASAHLPGLLSPYEQSLQQAENRITTLDHSVQGEAEKRVTAGAQVILDYYLDAHEIWQYKLKRLTRLEMNLRQAEQTAYSSSSFPYFFNSPVLEWVDKYPFLKASITTAPRKDRFIERAGGWNPDKAILLLWQKAKEETNNLSKWLKESSRSG